MDVYILNLIFTNQKNKKNQKDLKTQTGIHFKNLYPIILQDKFLNINSKSGVYSAIERMKNNGLIEITRIKKIPPEIIIILTKKGLDELKGFSGKISKSKSQEQVPEEFQNRIQKLTLSLSQSKEKIQELTISLKESNEQSKSLSQSLEKSQKQIQSLTISLEKSKSKKKTSKKKYVEKEIKELSDDEKADLIQSVSYRIIDVMDKDYDELSRAEAERVEKTAEKLIDQIRE